ncbi:DUF4276 family protein [Gibbsiella quercinecans]|uniref:DUF4276 family protein n=1 Tax=Gibbsiella quercinecans TaxID=929813 RepID=UPI00242CD55B|nr:DUF4276 family protein [Gibbsiella quercinecans]
MKTIAFFLEELSAEEMLKGLLPRVLPQDVDVKYITFEGKNDLEKRLPGKLRGWCLPDTTFVVIRDKDGGHGPTIKQRLAQSCADNAKHPYIVRIACHELESWYLGDLLSVENALGVPKLSNLQRNKKFRTPDNIGNASEELAKITKKKYQKVAGSRAIGKILRINGNASHSYNVFIQGIQNI